MRQIRRLALMRDATGLAFGMFHPKDNWDVGDPFTPHGEDALKFWFIFIIHASQTFVTNRLANRSGGEQSGDH